MSAGKVCKEAGADAAHAKRPAPHPGPRCTTCHRAVVKARRKAAHEKRSQSVYGLNEGEYDLLYEAQGGKCAIAKCRATGKTKKLAVEHDHKLEHLKRDSVRGLVCGPHNGWIGQAGDDPEVFESIAAYLRNPPARAVLGTVLDEEIDEEVDDFTRWLRGEIA